ncbi:amidohydrolase family protein [Variovorax terrae]|uniref:Amidohydrolase family protein n=1 Tax=Variovorax terrae TaxID=2923278 RepID=A0A9X1VQU0_9BURK|nr:amidohydrolase family protein [Variovorax terrae]MCJ0761653.1 amidohydrolase family protein [Variovorax terrae]
MTAARGALPAGACDTHVHIYDARVPAEPGGPPLPGAFSVEDYRRVQAALGLERVVLVQPNAYQFNNAVMLGALQALGTAARAVAVVPADVTDDALERMTRAGVRAQRFYALRWGALGLEALDTLMPRLHAFGWHANIQLDGRTLPEVEERLLRLPGHFVLDHVGKFLPPPDTGHPAFQSLLRLLGTGRCWVKLSAPYESSACLAGPQALQDVAVLVRALAAQAPERLLWASNWPHPFPPAGFVPDEEALMAFFRHCVPDEQVRRRILVDNPAQLYGF